MNPLFIIPLLLFAGLARAQQATPDGDPAELQQLRQQTTVQAIAAAGVLTEQYIKALAGIENEAASKGEYEQALAAQERRMALAEVQAQAVLTNTIVLKPAQARLTGSANYDNGSDALINWRTVGSTASWDVNRITPGAYEVTVVYGVAAIGDIPVRFNLNYNPSTGGEFEFYEDSSLTGAAQNRLPVAVKSTGSWTTYDSVKLSPPLQLLRTTARMTLRITRTNGDGGVLHLKEIRLTPVVAAKSSTQETPSDPLRSLLNTYQQKMKQVAAPIIADYITGLHDRLAEAAAKNATDAAAEWQAEIDRAARWLDRPPIPTKGRHAVNLLQEISEEWQDVRFVNDVSNTGDRFVVTHQGNQVRVRLRTVTCPPPNAEAAGELQHYAAYFRISAEDALRVGQTARDFTAASLQNQQLRLVTNGQKDREGFLLATVFVPHLGDLAGILVDNGLAAIVPPPRPKPNQPAVPRDPVYSALEARESQARQRVNPPGGWALSESTATPAP